MKNKPIPPPHHDSQFDWFSGWQQRYRQDQKHLLESQLFWVNKIYTCRAEKKSLPTVWDEAWQHVFGNALPSIRAKGAQLAQKIETDNDAVRLFFHNTQHTQDVLTLLAALLKAWRDISDSHKNDHPIPAWHENDAATTMLAMLGHDWGHDGGPFDRLERLEDHAAQQTSMALKSLLSPNEVTFWNDDLLHTLIGGTDPRLQNKVHDRWLDEGDSRTAWLQVLACEADIGTSLLPAHGLFLSQLLNEERRQWCISQGTPDLDNTNILNNQVQMMRQKFLQHARISSPCAETLGLKQLLKLEKSLMA